MPPRESIVAFIAQCSHPRTLDFLTMAHGSGWHPEQHFPGPPRFFSKRGTLHSTRRNVLRLGRRTFLSWTMRVQSVACRCGFKRLSIPSAQDAQSGWRFSLSMTIPQFKTKGFITFSFVRIAESQPSIFSRLEKRCVESPRKRLALGQRPPLRQCTGRAGLVRRVPLLGSG
jgi:hypothetical protein